MTINCLGQLIDLTVPKVMGILNLTPNSFYDGGKYHTEKEILLQVEKMLSEGTHFIDIGGYSSKPGADIVTESAEIARLVPAIDAILKHFPNTVISVDTFRSEVAKQTLDHGAAIINDISAGKLDAKMIATVAAYRVPYVMMHMKGTPQTMKSLARYDDVVKEVLFYFSERIAEARRSGINDLIVDPGFGFAKTTSQNYALLQRLELFETLDLPLLVGFSRKSMLYKPLGTSAEEALNGTTFANTVALMKGAKILRVHDVKQAKECVKLYELLA